MISTDKLLPPLTAEEAKEFNALQSEYVRLSGIISAHNHDGMKERKREIREKLKTAPANQLLTLSAELETLDGAFASAKEAAKHQRRALNSRYEAFFPALIAKTEAHADALLAKVRTAYAKHFEIVGAAPSGTSPIEAFLVRWKRQLQDRQADALTGASRGVAPVSILPYKVEEDLT